MPAIRIPRGRLQFSLRTMLLLFIPVALLAGLTTWLLRPAPLDVRITVETFSLLRYDDHAGNMPLAAVVRITNLSKSTTWILGYPEAPVTSTQQLVDGNWESSESWVRPVSLDQADNPLPKQWTPLRTMESLTIVTGPISEKATEIRVGLPFTTERFAPTEAHWVFSPAVEIVKRGQYYFPEPKPGAQQEEQVLSLDWRPLHRRKQSTSSSNP